LTRRPSTSVLGGVDRPSGNIGEGLGVGSRDVGHGHEESGLVLGCLEVVTAGGAEIVDELERAARVARLSDEVGLAVGEQKAVIDGRRRRRPASLRRVPFEQLVPVFRNDDRIGEAQRVRDGVAVAPDVMGEVVACVP
jgi:hypothetical protein